MLRYLLAFKQIGPAVLIICGERDPLMTMIVRQYVEVWRSELRLPVTVWFAREESAVQVEDRVISLGGVGSHRKPRESEQPGLTE